MVHVLVGGGKEFVQSKVGPASVTPLCSFVLKRLQRHLAEISARPAAVRALALKDKHAFKAEMDDAARLAMFPHLGKKVA